MDFVNRDLVARPNSARPMPKLSLEEILARLNCEEAAAIPDRAAFLDAACGSDADLRRLAGALYDRKFHTGIASEEDDAPEVPRVGGRVGPYRIERELGRGGMGVVYVAVRDDDQYHKRVAIKVLNLSRDSEELLHRFQNERQILANLDHPNICRLLDGGVTRAGLPYFVMEYVRDARPIDDYSNRHELGVRPRLMLFLKACAAVQHAHRFLIVHRDLKPSNILVSEDGEVKLMDFGIAKNLLACLDGSFHSQTLELQPMTPAYASPEQVNGEPITTSSDVYSLGVVLYELLTGQHPFRREEQPLPDLLSSICVLEAQRPSAAVLKRTEPWGGESPRRLSKTLRGDLDWIILMALRKDPNRRYASVEQLADDVRRVLARRPVRARKDTLRYRAWKFMGRHRFGVTAALLLVVTLFWGTISTQRQKARAEARFRDTRELAHSILFEISDAIRDLPGSTPARMLLVKRALTYLDKLASEAGNDLTLQSELAEAYHKIGEVQFKVGYPNIGDIAGALNSARKELDIRYKLAAAVPGVIPQLNLAAAHQRVSEIFDGTGDAFNAAHHLGKALEIREALNARDPGNAAIQEDLASTYRVMGDHLKTEGKPEEAIEWNRKAMAIRESLLSRTPGDPGLRRQLSMDLVRIADSLGSPNETNLGRYAEARSVYEKALVIRLELLAANPNSPTALREVGNIYQRMGVMLIETGEFQESLAMSRRSAQISQGLAADDPANFEVSRDLGVECDQIGVALERAGDVHGAEASLRRGLALKSALLARSPSSQRSQEDVAISNSLLGLLLARTHRYIEALTHLKESSDALTQIVATNADAGRYKLQLLRVLGSMAETYGTSQNWREARAAYQRALELARQLQAEGKLGAEDQDAPQRLTQALAGLPSA